MRVDLLNDGKDLIHQKGRQPHRRLIQQQELRLRHQPAPHRQHLLLPAGERPAVLAQPLLQPWEAPVHPLQTLLDPLRVVPRVCPHVQVLPHRQRSEDLPPLGNLNHAHLDDVVRRGPRDLCSFELDAPTPRPHQARDRVQRRRLAGPVCADQRHNLALFHLERDALKGVNSPVEDVQITHL